MYSHYVGISLLCHWLICHLPLAVSSSAQKTKPLFIGGFYGVNVSAKGWSSEGVIPAVKMALEHVNSDPSLLRGYTLIQHWRDSQCDSGVAIRAMLNLMNSPPPKLMFLGPGCSPAAEPIAEAAVYWGAIQIGYSTTSPLLSDKARFPLFFRTSPSETLTNPGIVSLLKFFNWKRVAIIVQNDNIFAQTKEHLVPLLLDANITVVFVESFANDPSSIIGNIKSKDVRIIIGFMYEDKFRKAVCQAFKLGIYGSKYVWFVPGWYGPNWWKVNSHLKDDCFPAEIKQAAGHFVATRPLPMDSSPVPTVSGKTAMDLLRELELKQRTFSRPDNDFTTFAYDAVWSIALTLNKSLSLLAARNRSLDDGDLLPANLFRKLLLNLTFRGMSGMVKFDKNGDRETITQILQAQDGEKRIVGVFGADKLMLNESLLKWEGGHVPSDGVQQTIYQVYTAPLEVTVTSLVIASLGVLFSICCLAFNVMYRSHRLIKMSSPVLNNITALGCAVCYLYTTLSAFTNSQLFAMNRDNLCQARLFLLTIGFTLAFGGMFMKTWRVYRIFTNRQLKRQIGGLSTISLVSKVVFISVFDIIIMAIWIYLDPLHDSIIQLPVQHDSMDPDVEVQITAHQCTCNHYTKWLMGVALYKGVLLLFGVFLAWETRDVQYIELNDSHNIGVAVYNIFLFFALTLSVEFAVTDVKTKRFFSEVAILICNTTVLCLVFVPKIKHVLWDNEVRPVTETNEAGNSMRDMPDYPASQRWTQGGRSTATHTVKKLALNETRSDCVRVEENRLRVDE